MLFNSISFLIFFPVVISLYFLVPHRYRTILLLIASGYFYMAFVPKYIFILFFLITVDYFLGKAIEKRTGRERKIFLIISILANIGTLFFFKYFNFFNENIVALANFLHWNYSPILLSIVLPIGLSFHVFQSLSYVIEVYRGKYQPEKNYLTYALYVMFFPQLVAGPIERPYNLLPQFHKENYFDYDRVITGLQRMLWGFFKKIVVADNLALYVNQVYNNSQDYSGLILLTATIFFAFQIYCDFSGYSDIAIGSAQVLGFKLMENFNNPYFSNSMAEFWRRWHISLSSWLHDYLFYPLMLSIKITYSRLRLYFALFTTFVLIGLWHGANWTFITFGAIHGFYLIFGQMTKNWRQKIAQIVGLSQLPQLHRFFQIIITFSLFSLSLIFFRASTLANAYYIATNSFYGLTDLAKGLMISIHKLNFYPILETLKPLLQPLTLKMIAVNRLTILVAIVIFVLAEVIDFRDNLFKSINSQRTWIRWLIYIIAVLFIMNLGVTHEIPFIYFQF